MFCKSCGKKTQNNEILCPACKEQMSDSDRSSSNITKQIAKYAELLMIKLKISLSAGRTLEEDRKKIYVLIVYLLNTLISFTFVIYVLSSKFTFLVNIFDMSHFSEEFKITLMSAYEQAYESEKLLIWIDAILYFAVTVILGFRYWHACAKREFNKYLKNIIRIGVIFAIIEIVYFVIEIILLFLGITFSLFLYVFTICIIADNIIFTLLYRSAAECEEVNS